MTEQMPGTIAKALVAAQKAVKPVEKASTNTHHKYAYASSDDMVAEARRAMTSVGLGLARVGWSEQPITEHTPARLLVSYLLTHESGDAWALAPVSVPVLPEKGRPEDKAEAAALTYSHGYVVLGLLQMARVDEGDVDARDDTQRGRYEGRRQGQPAGPKKSTADVAAMLAYFRDPKNTPDDIERAAGKARTRYDAGEVSDADAQTIQEAIAKARARVNGEV